MNHRPFTLLGSWPLCPPRVDGTQMPGGRVGTEPKVLDASDASGSTSNGHPTLLFLFTFSLINEIEAEARLKAGALTKGTDTFVWAIVV